MKNIKILFIGVMSLLLLSSCSDWLDVNTDPNYPSELVSPQVVVPTAQLGIANATMGWNMGFSGAFWSQYWTQNHNASQFKTLDQYTDQEFDDAYYNLTSTSLNDLKSVLTTTEESDAWHMIAELLSVYAWQTLTDTWGDVPYTEALQGDDYLFAPKFDTQESIYADLLKRVEKVLATDYSTSIVTLSQYDFIFDGDLDLWKQFAETLKLKLMIRTSETSIYNNSDVLAFVEASTFLTENAMINGEIWESTNGKQHPMVEYEELGAGYLGTNVIASRTFISYLSANADPRIDKYFIAPSNGVHKGSFQGDFASKGVDSDGSGTDDDQDEYSTVKFDSDSDIPLMSLWETNFYIAEVYARASDFVNAKAYYNLAVQSSFDYWGLASADVITGAGAYAEFTAATTEAAIEQISMQKWVAYCKLQHNEAFLERNRTKYPKVNTIDIAADRTAAHLNFPTGNFTISVAGRQKLNGSLPSSPIYPNDVISRNSNANSQKKDMGEAVWWNQRAEQFVN